MKSVWCGICRQEYNFPNDIDPTKWVDRHIETHRRDLTSAEEDYEIMNQQAEKQSQNLKFSKMYNRS